MNDILTSVPWWGWALAALLLLPFLARGLGCLFALAGIVLWLALMVLVLPLMLVPQFRHGWREHREARRLDRALREYGRGLR